MEFYYQNRSKNVLVWALVAYCMVCILFASVGFALAVYAFFFEFPIPFDMAMLLMLAMLLINGSVAVFALDLILWQITGKEKILITDKQIQVYHYGRIVKKQQSITIRNIKRVTANNFWSSVITSFFTPTKQGCVRVASANHAIYLGKNLTDAETQKLIELITQRVKVEESCQAI